MASKSPYVLSRPKQNLKLSQFGYLFSLSTLISTDAYETCVFYLTDALLSDLLSAVCTFFFLQKILPVPGFTGTGSAPL